MTRQFHLPISTLRLPLLYNAPVESKTPPEPIEILQDWQLPIELADEQNAEEGFGSRFEKPRRLAVANHWQVHPSQQFIQFHF